MEDTPQPITLAEFFTLDEIENHIKTRHPAAVAELAEARMRRDAMNDHIKLLVAEVAKSARFIRHIEGRKTKKT